MYRDSAVLKILRIGSTFLAIELRSKIVTTVLIRTHSYLRQLFVVNNALTAKPYYETNKIV